MGYRTTKLNLTKNYIAMIHGSVGTRMFQHLYTLSETEASTDIVRSGELSCAYFVSFILNAHKLIQGPHATVDSTVKDLLASGWSSIQKPKIGAVLVWEVKQESGEPHRHIGFYIGREQAISNSTSKKVPMRHHWTYNDKRKVEHILWHSLLEK